MDSETARVIRKINARQSRTAAGANKSMPTGTTFPTGIGAGFLFFRSDLGFLCYYDGTRWLTVHEYVIATNPNRTVVAVNTIWDTTIRFDFAPWFTRVALTTNAAAVNNGTNFWTIAVQGVDLALAAATTFYNPNTSADTAGVETDHGGNVGSNNSPTNRQFLRLAVAKTLTPGNLTISCSVSYRLVVT